MREKIVLAGLIVAVMIFAMSCTAVDYSLEGDVKKDLQDSVSNTPISVKLTASLLSLTEQSTFGSEADLVMEVSLYPSFPRIAHNVTANITLPEGITLVSGDTTWSGDLVPGDSESLSIVVKAGEVGNWTVTGSARWYFAGDPSLGWYGGVDSVCFSVSEDNVTTKSGECYVKPELPPGFGEAEPEPPEGIQPPQPQEPPLEPPSLR